MGSTTSPPRLTRRDALTLAATAWALSCARTCSWPAQVLAADGRTAPATRATLELTARDFGPAHASHGARRMAVSRVLHAPRRFDLVGLHYRHGRVVPAEVRARRRGEAWTEWIALAAGSAHAPDGGRRRTSEPACFAGADELQLRLDLERPLPAVQLVSGRPRTSQRRALAPAVAVATVAPGGGPPIVMRKAWGANRIIPRAAPRYGQVRLAFVHHTVSANDYGPQDSAAMVLAIARYHRDTNGWNDIGYNFVVDRFGQIFEGRAGGIERAVIGAHAQGYNGMSTGVALLGTHGVEPATPAAVAALATLIGWKLARHRTPSSGQVQVISAGGPTNRHPAGQRVVLQRIAGHGDGDRTACPGDALRDQLPAIRVAATAAAVGIAPDVLSAHTPTDRVSARGRGALIRGSAPGQSIVRLAVSRRVGGRWRWIATVRVRSLRSGRFRVRLRLPKPGLYRLTARVGTIRAEPLMVRSVRR